MLRYLLPLASLLLLVGCERTATVDLSMEVRDEGDQPVVGAVVSISSDDRLLKTLTTDPKGHFRYVHTESYTCDLEYCDAPNFSVLVARSSDPLAARTRLPDVQRERGIVRLISTPQAALEAAGLQFDVGSTMRPVLVDEWLSWRPSDGPLPLLLLRPAARHTVRAADDPRAANLWSGDANTARSWSDAIDLTIPEPAPTLPLPSSYPSGPDLSSLTDGSFVNYALIEESPRFDVTLSAPTTLHSIGAVGVLDYQGAPSGGIALELRTTTGILEVPASACESGADWILCTGEFASVKHVQVVLTPAGGRTLGGVRIAEMLVR